jgi:sterol desaturase/sphingolipid hydroxylase (fatty acid hydroxylase superfamily)
MQALKLIQYAPIVMIVFVEACLRVRHEMHEYKVKDTLANMLIAAFNLIIGIFLKGTIFLILVNLQNVSLFNFGTSLAVCIILFLLSDLIHYAIHYLEHKSRFFWAIHSVHHSSDSYNFSVALRTANANCLYKFFYEAPLVLFGFDAFQVVMIHNGILLLAFFQHTELIKKLGWLECFLNTPSHHRVHHASNEKYIDKNFGAILIIWDRLFGTFQVEDEKPVYGLTKPIKTYNPVKIVFHEWIAMVKDLFKSRSLKEVFSYMFNRPGWKPEEEESVPVQKTATAGKLNCEKCGQCSLSCLSHVRTLERSLTFS